MTATWNISNCDWWKVKDENEKVIFRLHWNCTDSREYPNPDPKPDPKPEDEPGSEHGAWSEVLTAHGSIIGTCELASDGVENFIPFEDVTKEQALAWLFSVMTVEQKSQSENNVERQIQFQIDPPTASGNPWS